MAYHRDIGSYFVQPPNAYGQQTTLPPAYQSLVYTIQQLPTGPETSVALRKLLESFDAAMRAAA